jgi:hypothetical protein
MLAPEYARLNAELFGQRDPTAEKRLAILLGSDVVMLAIDDGAVVGYATAISDGVLLCAVVRSRVTAERWPSLPSFRLSPSPGWRLSPRDLGESR